MFCTFQTCYANKQIGHRNQKDTRRTKHELPRTGSSTYKVKISDSKQIALVMPRAGTVRALPIASANYVKSHAIFKATGPLHYGTKKVASKVHTRPLIITSKMINKSVSEKEKHYPYPYNYSTVCLLVYNYAREDMFCAPAFS